jgi:hypothetical protein
MADLDFDTEETKTKPQNLTDDEITVLSYVEQKYWETGSVPTMEKSAQDLKMDVNVVKKAWKKQTFNDALIARGLKWDSRGDGILTPKQIVLVNMLMSVNDGLSLRQKLGAIQVTQQQYQAWLRDPHFQNYLRMRTEQVFEIADVEVLQALQETAKNGDVQAIKLFAEMRGIYNPRTTVDINIDTVIYRVVDIVARYVKDPAIIESIASELESINVNSRSSITKSVMDASFAI